MKGFKMRKIKLLNIILSFSVLSLLMIPQALSAYEATKIKPNFIKVNAVKYRRSAAESAQLGSIGSKKGRVGKVPTYERRQFWKGGKLRVTQDTVLTLTSSQINTFSAEGHMTDGVRSAGANVQGDSSIEGSYVLAKYTLVNSDVINKINALSKNKRKKIKKYKRGRIITSIWVIISGEEQQSGNYSGTLTMSDQNNDGTVTITHQGTSSIRFRPNTIIAYEYKKLKWKKGKKVKSLERDGVWR